MNLAGLSVDKPVSVSMIIMIILVVGGIALSRLGIDLFPDIDYPSLTVMVRYPGASSEEVETMVAKPYEGSFAAVSNVEKVRSISQEDVCYFLVDFVWGTDLDAAASDLRESVAMIEPYMPDGVEDPVVIKFNLSAMPLAVYAVGGMEDTVRLRKIMTDNVQDRIERLAGVAQASFFGGRIEEIHVDLDRAALLGSGVTIDQVVMALRAQNLDLPAGRQVEGRTERLVRTIGSYDNVEEIGRTAVGWSPTTRTPIPLASLGTVQRTTRDVRTLIRMGPTEAIMFMVSKESGANPLQVRRQYMEELERFKTVLPPEIHFEPLFDMGRMVERMVRTVVQSGIIGGLLAILVMWVFLRNWRPTLIIALAIPLSILVTFIPLYLSGYTLNMMTMGGLVLGIGMLVDNGVVVIENIFRHIEEGKDRKAAARIGASEVGLAISASTFTTIVVFIPILFAKGLAGQLSRGLALTVTFALLASLVVALTIVPMLASILLATRIDSGGHTSALGRESSRFLRFRERYQRFLESCLRHRRRTIGAVGGLVVISAIALVFVGKEFMPGGSDPILMAKVSFPVGTPLAETSAASARVEDVFSTFPDVQAVGSQIGADDNDPGGGMSDANPTGPHQGILYARLKESDQREYYSNEALQDAIRKKLPEIPGMTFEFLASGGMGGSASPVEVQIFGLDLDAMRLVADRVAAAMTTVPGLADVRATFDLAKPERHIRVDREKAATYGLTVGQVAMAVQAATQGTLATRYREGGDELDVRVRYAEPWRDDLAALRQVLVPLPTGGSVPLDQLAVLDEGVGPVRIVRDDQKRMITVVANLAGTDLGSAMQGVREAVDPIAKALPSGYDIVYGGQYEDMADAFGQLAIALLLAILMVYMVMASQFESFVHPFTTLFTVPLALVGVVWAFLISGTTLSVVSFVGCVMLAGIVVNNGIVMVDYINQLRARGLGLMEATAQGAATRLRPVLITSLTTIIGTVPMAVNRGEGSSTMAPLALTIIGGLTTATFLTLLVVPVVYTLMDGMGVRVRATFLRWFHRAEAEARGV
ncbi:MAG: efflux RND transporter permease subunit [Deltaproteobacteria bacterium]|nr:efflux RND transporter permease subunit [Deltaproteobacteria bacterium]